MKKLIMIGMIASSLLISMSFNKADDCELRILVYYTSEAATANVKIQSSIRSAVNNIDDSFTNSQIGHTVTLAGILPASGYTQPSCFYETLEEFKIPGDNKLDFVHTDRDLYRADVVVLVVDNKARCGLTDNTLGADNAFIVVDEDCLGKNYSLARQLGYLYQAGNNEQQSEADGAFFGANQSGRAYWYEDWDSASSFQTIMGYTDEAKSSDYSDFKMIPYWSSHGHGITYNINGNDILVGDQNHNNAGIIKANALILLDYKENQADVNISGKTLNSSEYLSPVALEHLNLEVVTNNQSELSAVSGEEIVLQSGTHLKSGSEVSLVIDTALDGCSLPNGTTNRQVAVYTSTEINEEDEQAEEEEEKIIEETNEEKLQVYPNPFNETATVAFYLEHPSEVSVVLMDLKGRVVRVLESARQRTAGAHKINVTGNNLHRGIYLLRLMTNSYVETKRVVFNGW